MASQADLRNWEQLERSRVLVDAHAKARKKVETLTLKKVDQILGEFDKWGEWNNQRDRERVLTQIVRVLEDGQRETARFTVAYLDGVEKYLVEDRKFRKTSLLLPKDVRSREENRLRLQRVFREYWWRLEEGDTPRQALYRAQLRAREMVEMDLRLAFTHQARGWAQARDGYHTWRRVIRPELSQDGACALCVVAADRVYHKENLLPLHTGCNCTVLPEAEAHMRGLAFNLNSEDLDALYAASPGGVRGAELQEVKVKIEWHGEYGPVLTNARHEFTGVESVRERGGWALADWDKYRASGD